MNKTKIYKHLSKQKDFESNLRYLEEILVRFSHLIIHFPHIKEIDINPFFVSSDDSFVLDANILLEADILEGFVPVRGDFCPPHLSICPYPGSIYRYFQIKRRSRNRHKTYPTGR